jgi:D-alanine-D-alanine ligase
MKRVGLIFGSRSVEHEVSVTTAGKVFEVLDPLADRYEAIPIYITKSGVWLTGPAVREMLALDAAVRAGGNLEARVAAKDRFQAKLASLAQGADAPGTEQLFVAPDPTVRSFAVDPERGGWFRRRVAPRVDVAFPLIHGTHGEDGTLQGLLEMADIPYVGAGVTASAVGMDKLLSKLVFRGAGLPILDWVALTRRQFLENEAQAVQTIEAALTYPMVVKPAAAGSSVGITRVAAPRDLVPALQRAARFSPRVLAEPCLEQRQEVQCAVLGNHALTVSACEELVRSTDIVDFEQKYLRRERQQEAADLAPSRIPAEIPEALAREIQTLARAAFRAIDGRGICRVDFLIDAATMRPYVNEVNTLPGSLCLRLWEVSGLKPPDLIERLLDLAFEARGEKQATRYESEEGGMLVDRKHLMIPGK